MALGCGDDQVDFSGCLIRSFSPPGLLMNLKYYVSPYDLFEDGAGAPVVLHENNGRSAEELLGDKEAEFQPGCPLLSPRHRLSCGGHRFSEPRCEHRPR